MSAESVALCRTGPHLHLRQRLRCIDSEHGIKLRGLNWQPRPISATKVATDYVNGAQEFFDKVVDLCTRLDDAGNEDHPRQEACAALWATMVTAVEASSFNAEDRKQILPLILEAYLPFWKKRCGTQGRPQEKCTRYLQARDPQSHLRTAVAMVESLLEALRIPQAVRSSYSRLFSGLFAHRILSDVQYFNDIKANYSLK